MVFGVGGGDEDDKWLNFEDRIDSIWCWIRCGKGERGVQKDFIVLGLCNQKEGVVIFYDGEDCRRNFFGGEN